jgi:hypothetical protein
MNLHEEAFVKAFVVPDRQERFLGFLGDSKKRRRLITEFDHLRSRLLDPRFMIPLQGSQSLPPNVFATLRKIGAPEKCWAMGGRFDGQEKQLLEALRDSGDGFVLSCIPGKLAYMKTEDDEYILKRP